ncbi:MAG: DUF4166 domain-containing protein [Fibrobacteres bacterium]|jgi:hypothetical protein|nr:DUF4166 domain-containing protein [Fibrobacterota bacterium]
MRSIYAQAMGPDFAKLHPNIQERFGFRSADGIASIGKGVMEEVWLGPVYTVPFLYVGAWRNIMFPQQGRNVPFTIENYAYTDGFGRETVTWVRKYEFPGKRRRFDATMIYSPARARIVDYLGTHQHLAVDIGLSVAPNGGLRLVSGEQRFYEGFLGFRFPMLFSGRAEVCEWFDESQGRFRISVEVSNRFWGRLFGYRGSFDVEYRPVASASEIPADVKPVREERRE